uniref:C3H1-type domain-containing protein n=1 Tax=Romanomermis culicivorax TaxID=13658 RepID=A0A915HKE5_ROMCU
ASSSGIPCKFANRCINSVCPFRHPKPCTFGAQCLRPGCTFSHPPKKVLPGSAPVAQKFKWVAPAKKTAAEDNEATAQPDLIAIKG